MSDQHCPRLAAPRRSRGMPSAFRKAALVAAIATALPAFPAHAIELFWDANTIGVGIGGSGTWNLTNRNWAVNQGGIRFVSPVLNTGQAWTNSFADTAVFDGVAGNVTVGSTISAGALDFRVDGYRLTGNAISLGNPLTRAPGAVHVVRGATVEIASALSGPLVDGARPYTLDGGGTLVLSSPARQVSSVTVTSSTLRAGSEDVLGGTGVTLSGATARLDLGGLPKARVGAFVGNDAVLALGDTQLEITNAVASPIISEIHAGVSGSARSGITIVGAQTDQIFVGQPIAGAVPTTSSIGFLHLAGVFAVFNRASFSLAATEPEFTAPLLVERGARVDFFRSDLTVAGSAILRGDSNLAVSAATFSVERDARTPGSFALLSVGAEGGGVSVTQAAGGRIESADVIRLGNVVNGAVTDAVMFASQGGRLQAPILSFASANSVAQVLTSTTGRFNRFDGRAAGSMGGQVFITGAEFVIGDETLVSALDTGPSTFNGILTGDSGTFRKVGAGTTFLTNNGSTFAGRVRIDSGTLDVAPGTLKNAILDIAPDGTLRVPLAGAATPVSIGAIDGSFDLALRDTTLLMGGGNHDTTWRGRLPSGTVGLRRETGTGIQTIVGGTVDAPFVAPFLSTSAGTFRLDGGRFRFTNSTLSAVNTTSLFAELAGRIEIGGGAIVDAGSGARIHNDGRILVTGAGTKLSLFPGAGQVDSQFLVGQFGGGTLTVTDGASADATFFLLGNTGQATPKSEIVVSRGGELKARNIIFDGPESRLTVDGGSVFSHFVFVRSPSTFKGGIFLSDRDADSPALTLGKGFDGIDFGNEFSFDGRIADAAGGPGSLRKVGTGFLAITTPLEITGRLIVDGGQVRATQARSLASVVARLNTDEALLYAPELVTNGVVIGGLEGSGNLGFANGAVKIGHATDATWRGRFTSGTVGIARTQGAGIQTFVGGTSDAPFVAPFLSVSTGTVRLAGGHFQFTNQAFSARDDASLFAELSGLIDITDGADVRAGTGVRIHNGARILVRGTDTRLTVTLSSGDASVIVGGLGGGTFEITDGARVTARTFTLGSFDESTEVSRLIVSRGASLVTESPPGALGNGILFAGLHSSLTVDRATARLQRLVIATPAEGGAVFLSDDPLLGPALTLGEGAPGFLLSELTGRIADAAGGPGSIRKVGPDQIILGRPLEITGRVIVDAGSFQIGSGDALASVLVQLNTDSGVDFAAPASVTRYRVMGLEGAGTLGLADATMVFGGDARDATWRGRFTTGTVGLRRESGTGTQTFVGGTADAPFVAPFLSTSAGGFRLDGGHFRFTNTTGAVVNTTSLFSQPQGLIEITGGATVEAGSGARIHDGGRIVVTGAGTRLSLFPGAEQTVSQFLVGQFGGGTLTVTDGASADATFFVLGNTGQATPRSELVVSNGGVLKARNIQFEGQNSVLTVDRGSVQSHFLFVRNPATFKGGVFLSDRDAASPALTLGKGFDGFDFGNEFSFDGRIADASSGPGSIRKLGIGTLALTRPLEITGRMIVDGGKVRLGSAADLATVTLVVGTNDALALDRFTTSQTFSFGGLAGAADLDLGTLHSLTLGSQPRSARFDGHLALGGTLAKVGAGTQTFTGGAEAAHLVVNDGNVILQGGSYVLVGSTNGGVPPSLATNTTGHLSMTGNVSLDVRNGATATAAGGIFVDAGAHIAVAAGGRVQAEAVVLDFGSLTNNGTLSGQLIVEEGGVAKGGGTFDAITVNAGGTFAPGNSPGVAHAGSVTINPGARFEVEVGDATGEAGVGFDLWDVEGTVDFDAGATGDDRFVIVLVSLDAGNTPGLARHFDPSQQFSWTVLRADAVRGFDPAEVRIDASGFANPRHGEFAVTLDSSDERAELRIVYQPVPEPGTNAMIVCGLAALLVWRRRARRG